MQTNPRYLRGSTKMNLRFLSLLAGVLLLAACADTTPTTGGAAGGASAATPSTSSSGSVQPRTEQDLVQNVGDRVFFDYDKSDIKPDGRQGLQRPADWLTE